MRDHEYYDELAALSAGGHLSREEHDELREHLRGCEECRLGVRAYEGLVNSALPFARDAAAANGERATAVPDAGARDRFLARARAAGVGVSSEVTAPEASTRRGLGYRVAAGLALAAAAVLALYVPDVWRRVAAGRDAHEQVEGLARENANLAEQVATRDRDLANREAQLRMVQSQLAASVQTGNSQRRPSGPGFQLGQSTSQEARLLEEIQSRDHQLAAAAEEISRINQLHVTDRSALDAQGTRLREAFDQLRIATATIDMERQLAAAGRDILQLMLAKQLRVVDVRDTDVNGRPSPAFARVFIADGKTIRIFAFDLNDGGSAGPRRFQVWGEQLGKAGSVRSLGTLDVDDRTQNRWSLAIQGADVVKDINSLFVTTPSRGNAPDGPRLLYAFLGT